MVPSRRNGRSPMRLYSSRRTLVLVATTCLAAYWATKGFRWTGQQAEYSFASGSPASASGCTPERAVLGAQYFASIAYDQTSCPDDAWLEDLQQLEPASDVLLVNIGVNKGYNLLRWLNVWRPDIHLCPSDWHAALDVPQDEACGACGDCRAPCHHRDLATSAQILPRLTMVGMDPNAQTLASLQQALERLRLHQTPGVDIHLVLGAAGDKAGEVTLNAFCGKNGNEVCAVQQGGGSPGAITVPMYTVDGLGSASTALEALLRSQRPIDILHIDTEGYDPNVIKGALNTLKHGGARLLNFEYHEVGLWKDISLKAVVSLLDGIGYDCWFQGQRRLFRLTGCYVPQWEIKAWSNVACARRGDSYHRVLSKYEFRYEAPTTEADQSWLAGALAQ